MEEGMDQRAFGQLLKRLREAKGYRSHREAASHMHGVSYGYLSQLERGVVGKPSVPVLRELARAYGVELAYLINACFGTDLSEASGEDRDEALRLYSEMDERGRRIAERLIRELYQSFTRPDEPLRVA